MLFVSNAANVLAKKAIIAKQRMFLFSNNIERPKNTDTIGDMLLKINGSRGFCAKVEADQTMSCVRSAGWKGNRIYYNYVPSVKESYTGADTNGGALTLSIFDLFSRFYSIGRNSNSNLYFYNEGSALETVEHEPISAPVQNVMVLPPCDGTLISSLSTGLSHVPQSGVSYGYTTSGNYTTSLGIVTGRWTDTVSTNYSYLFVKGLDVKADTASLNKIYQSINSTTYMTDILTNGPRLFAASTKTYHLVLNPYSDTVQSSNTYYAKGPYASTTNIVDSNVLYGTGIKADTGEYSLTWGMMPVVGQARSHPMYAFVFNVGDDFEQTGTTLPGVKPVMKIKNMNAFAMTNKVPV